MATPHIAGLATLWAGATGFRGRELWATLMQEGERLLEPSVDVGSGLGLAPQRGSSSVSYRRTMILVNVTVRAIPLRQYPAGR